MSTPRVLTRHNDISLISGQKLRHMAGIWGFLDVSSHHSHVCCLLVNHSFSASMEPRNFGSLKELPQAGYEGVCPFQKHLNSQNTMGREPKVCRINEPKFVRYSVRGKPQHAASVEMKVLLLITLCRIS